MLLVSKIYLTPKRYIFEDGSGATLMEGGVIISYNWTEDDVKLYPYSTDVKEGKSVLRIDTALYYVAEGWWKELTD